MDLTAELADFRALAKDFVAKEITPHHGQWEKDEIVPREVWLKAGSAGLLGLNLPEKFGGGGLEDFRFNAALVEALYYAGATGPGFGLHNDICAPYFTSLANDEQLERWVPGMTDGSLISAIAMTEPGAGSDLQGIRTSGTEVEGGWKVNGAKTFITNGINADLVITAVRTDPAKGKGMSLMVLERGMPGFERGRNLDKLGMHAQDTAELSFNDVFVPRENLLGEEGMGLSYLMLNLAQERLSVSVQAVAATEGAFDSTLAYIKDRKAFGQSIGTFQHNAFLMAELFTEVKTSRVLLDWAINEHLAGHLPIDTAALVKLQTTEMQQRVLDRCLQLHGGYGYMQEYGVGRAWADARVQTIYAGSSEIMKLIISRGLGLRG